MAAIEVGEEVAVSTGLVAWLAKWGSVGVGLAELLFGSRPHEPALNNSIGPLAQFLKAPFSLVHQLTDVSTQALAASVRAVAGSYAYTSAVKTHLQADTLRARHDLIGELHRQVTGVLGELHSRLSALDARLSGRISAVTAAQLRAERDVLAELRRQVTGVLGELHTRLSTEAGTRARGDAQLATQIRATGTADRTYADTVSTRAAARSTGLLSRQSVAGLDQSWAGIRSDLEASAVAAGAGLPEITALIRAVPTAAPTTLPAAAEDIGKITRVLTRTMRDCTVDNCRNLSKYGKDLHGLGQALGGALFIAFLVWAIEHPDQAARETQATAGALVDETVHLVRNLIGV
jgi:hypothetical protein